MRMSDSGGPGGAVGGSHIVQPGLSPDLRKRGSVGFQIARGSSADAPDPHGLDPAGQEEGGTSTMRSVDSA